MVQTWELKQIVDDAAYFHNGLAWALTPHLHLVLKCDLYLDKLFR